MPGERGATPFIILSAARSGTNLLRGMLNQHPRVRCLDEVLLHEVPLAGDLDPELVGDAAAQQALARDFTAEPERFLLERVFHDPTTPRDACGFRLFYEHPPGPRAERVWAFLAGLAGLKVVHLRRQGELRRYVSLLQAMETDVWLQPVPSEAPPPPVFVDVERLLEAAAIVERDRERALARLSGHERLEVVYESLARDPEREATRALEFLGVGQLALRPLYARQGTESLGASIVNARSLRTRLQGTPMGRELDDDLPLADPPPPSAWRHRRDAPLRLFGQVGEADRDILPAFLDHYLALGVRRFHLVLHGSEDGRRALREAIGRQPVEVEEEDGGPFDDRQAYARLTRLARGHDGEWAIVADADEFLELPYGGLARTIRALSLAGATSLPAVLVQRVAAGGTRPALEAGADPHRTYPLASVSLTARLLPGSPPWLEKAPLFLVHDGTELALGHHLPPDGLARSPLPLRAVVHHFKWRAGLVESQRRRCREPLTNAHEVLALSGALEETGGLLPIEGAFECSRHALFERGLLRCPDRGQRRHAALLTRLRRSRSAQPGGPPGVPRRRRGGGQPGLSSGRGRMAFVTHELAPPSRTGGIGSYVAAAAQSLSAAGHAVTVALLSPLSEPEKASWRDVWRRRGIELECLADAAGGRPLGDPGAGARIAAWLHGRAFDVVHFADCGGLGAEAATARRQGLLLASTTTVVTLHGGVGWHTRANGSPRTLEELRLGHAEDLQLAAADWVVSPSRFMLELLDREGRRLPDRRSVLPSVIGSDMRRGDLPPWTAEGRPGLGEIVFFGRLEPRKGLDLFCDALDRLAGWRSDVSAAFLGAPASREWRSYAEERAKRWDRRVVFHENLSTADAVLLLSEGRRLAVMPSRADNHPYTVLECVAAGIPFLATAVGGIPEMVHQQDNARVLVLPDEVALAGAIRRAVDEGHAAARPARRPEDVEREFLAWHADRLARREREIPSVDAVRTAPEPSLDVVVLSDPQGGYAVPAAEAMARQRGVEFELRVGDDSLTPADAARIWRRGPRVSKGCRGVRRVAVSDVRGAPERANAMVRGSEAEYLLLCRADAVGDVRLAALLLRACVTESAQAAVSDHFVSSSGSAHGGALARAWSPAGPLALAPHENLFGGCCFLIRRSAFETLGGFRDDPSLEGNEHWDLLNRLLLEGGRVARVPLPLYRLHVPEVAVPSARPPRWAMRAGWSPFLERVPGALRDTFALLVDLEWSSEHPHVGQMPALPVSPAEGPSVPLLSLSGGGVDGALEAVQQATVEPTAAALEVVSTGPDPILLLPALAFPPGRQALRVVVEMDCDRSSLAQLFWISEGRDGYTEEDSVRGLTLRGPNVVQLSTPEIVPTGRLRFDPAVHPGRVAIRSLTVESLPAVATDSPPAPAQPAVPAAEGAPACPDPAPVAPPAQPPPPAAGTTPGWRGRARRWLRGVRDPG